MNSRDERKEKRRQDILNAGLNIFIRKGYGAAKITDIADAAEMSMGLLYHYFSSAEVLYEELIDIALSGRTGQYFPEYDSPLDYFLKSSRYIFDMVNDDPYVAGLFLLVSQAERSPNLPKHISDKLGENQVIAKSIKLVEEGQRQGVIRSGDPAALAMAFWISIQGNIEMIALNPNMPRPESDWFIGILTGSNGQKS